MQCVLEPGDEDRYSVEENFVCPSISCNKPHNTFLDIDNSYSWLLFSAQEQGTYTYTVIRVIL